MPKSFPWSMWEMGSDNTIKLNALVLHGEDKLSYNPAVYRWPCLWISCSNHCIDSNQFEILASYNSASSYNFVSNTLALFSSVMKEVLPKPIFLLLKTKLILFKPHQHKAAVFAWLISFSSHHPTQRINERNRKLIITKKQNKSRI